MTMGTAATLTTSSSDIRIYFEIITPAEPTNEYYAVGWAGSTMADCNDGFAVYKFDGKDRVIDLRFIG